MSENRPSRRVKTEPRTSWLLFRTAPCHSQSVGESPEPATIAKLANAGAMEKSLVHTVRNIGRCALTMHPILVAGRICSQPLSQTTRDKQALEDFLVGGRMATETP